jgi:3-phenylpropionate/trans-cinnamate dioxygenase ferredoxin subunit
MFKFYTVYLYTDTMLNYTTFDESKVEFIEIVPAVELPSGERLICRDLEGKPVVIFNIAGQFFAIGDVCTHDGGPLGDGMTWKLQYRLSAPWRRVRCPHGAGVQMPAVVDIPAYPVQVRDGMIFVGIPKE